MDPLATVLLSVKNGVPYIRDAVRSILAQSFEDWRMVVVDDGSSDDTSEVIESIAGDDARVEIVRNPVSLGLGAVLAREVERATTPWIARMDGDDISMPERFEIQAEFSRLNPEVHLHGTWAIEIDEQGAQIGTRKVPVTDAEIKRLVWANPFIHPTVWFQRDAILKAGNYDSRIVRREDYELWFRCVAAGVRSANIPEHLLKYRVAADHFSRDNWRVVASHFRVGWAGCARVSAPLEAYLGVAAKAMGQVAPPGMRPILHRALKRMDPRTRV